MSFIKDPLSITAYGVEWEDWLEGATIDSSTWVLPVEITKDAESIDGALCIIVLSGGTLDDNYPVRNIITFSSGLKEVRTLDISMRTK